MTISLVRRSMPDAPKAVPRKGRAVFIRSGTCAKVADRGPGSPLAKNCLTVMGALWASSWDTIDIELLQPERMKDI